MAGDTGKLVHQHAYHLGAAAYLNAGGLLYGHAQTVVIGMGREVIQSVHEMKCLRISELLAYFFDAAVDISHVDIDFIYGLAIDRRAETEHAVGGGMLRADVDHEVLGLEHHHLFFLDFSVGGFHVCVSEIALTLAVGGHGVELGIFVVVLAERMTVPVNAQEEAAHVGVAYEHYSEEVVDLALEDTGYMPEISHAVEHRLLYIVGGNFHGQMAAVGGGGEIIDTAHLLLPVHTYDCHEEVEPEFLVIAELSGKIGPLGVGNAYCQCVTGLESGLGLQSGNYFLKFCHIDCLLIFSLL